MWNREKTTKASKLSKELLWIFLLAFAIALFAFFFLSLIADGLLISYLDSNNIILSEMQEITYSTWITALSFLGSTGVFIILFLILVGQKLSYLKDIIEGINALTAHRLDYQIPLKDNNEFTHLAHAINKMSQTELDLKRKEEALIKEREDFIRNISHDIRTPLTAIIAHTEFLKANSDSKNEDINEYIDMTLRKSLQIKELTDRLLNSKTTSQNTNKVYIEDGKLLFVQLCDEWLDSLEDNYSCQVDISDDISFSGNYDVHQFIRIFDNLASNVEKYADSNKDVHLAVYKEDGRLLLEQGNYKALTNLPIESHKIGLESIKQIAEGFGGNVKVNETKEFFNIKITLFSI